MDPAIQIVLTMSQDGNVNVKLSGSRLDKVTILGMLEMAKSAITVEKKEEAQAPILLARRAI